jgi:hypothetical protein
LLRAAPAAPHGEDRESNKDSRDCGLRFEDVECSMALPLTTLPLAKVRVRAALTTARERSAIHEFWALLTRVNVRRARLA